MSMCDKAFEELKRAGLFDKSSDYEGNIGHAVMELMDTFAEQGHSGFSAMMVLEIFDRLAKQKTLTPITNDPNEWDDMSHLGAKDHPSLWQNTRDNSYFSNDGGKTWWNVEDKKKK